MSSLGQSRKRLVKGLIRVQGRKKRKEEGIGD
jgi:hypothetical protein